MSLTILRKNYLFNVWFDSDVKFEQTLFFDNLSRIYLKKEKIHLTLTRG